MYINICIYLYVWDKPRIGDESDHRMVFSNNPLCPWDDPSVAIKCQMHMEMIIKWDIYWDINGYNHYMDSKYEINMNISGY